MNLTWSKNDLDGIDEKTPEFIEIHVSDSSSPYQRSNSEESGVLEYDEGRMWSRVSTWSLFLDHRRRSMNKYRSTMDVVLSSLVSYVTMIVEKMCVFSLSMTMNSDWILTEYSSFWVNGWIWSTRKTKRKSWLSYVSDLSTNRRSEWLVCSRKSSEHFSQLSATT